jgi:lysophospholipase L1-like esterase
VQCINLGKVSATLKERGEKHTNTLGAQLNRIPQGINPDAIIVEGGINDDADPQSVVDDYTSCVTNQKRTTFAGALAYIVSNLKVRLPAAKIYVITPGGLYYGHTDSPFDYIVKADQIRKAAQLLGVPTIDWDKEGRLSFVFNNSKGTGSGTNASPFLYNIPSRETGDLLHPNEIGAVYLAENVIKELRP